jgi:hypothetical protein
MTTKSSKPKQFIEIIHKELYGIVDDYSAGHLENPDDLKSALTLFFDKKVKESFINGIKIGERKKRR